MVSSCVRLSLGGVRNDGAVVVVLWQWLLFVGFEYRASAVGYDPSEEGIMEMTGSSVDIVVVLLSPLSLSSSLPSSIILLLPKAFMGDCTALTNACASRSNSSFPKGCPVVRLTTEKTS